MSNLSTDITSSESSTLNEYIKLHLKLDDDKLEPLLEGMFQLHSTDAINNWNDGNNHGNRLIHVLVLQNKVKSIKKAIALGLDINAQRSKDLNTPLHIAGWSKLELVPILLELGASTDLKNTYNETYNDLILKKSSMDNIIFLDLELTCLPEDGIPKIMECAVIIVNAQLNEVVRNEWIIHFDDEELNKLSPWHQKTFASLEKGGNGLLDECRKSTITYEQFETEILELLTKNCIPKANPLGGYSVHCDREIMFQCARPIYNFVSHQVIDVSTLLSLCRRWNLPLYNQREAAMYSENRSMAHRAMFDVEDSIKTLKWLRQNMFAINDIEYKRSNLKEQKLI